MAKEQHPEGLDDEASLSHHQRAHKIRVAGRVMVGILLLAAAIGLFGSGVLSRAKAGNEGSAFWVEYDRFVHYQATIELRMHVQPPASTGGVQIWIDREYADGLEIMQISPNPERMEAEDGRIRYTFLFANARAPIVITYRCETARMGKREASMGVVGGPEERFSQLVYP